MSNKIVGIEDLGYTDELVYDLEVDHNHNYTVGEQQTLVHNCHTGAANKYAKTLSVLNCKFKIGLSGTPSRKDNRFVLMKALIGPNIYEAKVERLKPAIRLIRTGYVNNSKGRVPWVRIVSALEKNPKRLKLIAEWAIKDAENGHMVIIPMAQVTPIRVLIETINKIAGKKIAYPFYGGVPKEKRNLYIQKAREYKIKILVGNTKLLSTGINIPRASCLFEIALSSNLENCEQRISRILTPWEDKPQPLVRYFLDELSVRKRCIQNEWYNCILPKFRPLISDKDSIALKSYFKSKVTLEPFEL